MNDVTTEIALRNRVTRRAWRTCARAVLTFGFLWAVAVMFVLGWLAVTQ